MYTSIFITMVLAVAGANCYSNRHQDYYTQPQIVLDRLLLLIYCYPQWILDRQDGGLSRMRRDVTLDHKMGDGRVFGTLGNTDTGLFGKAGYERNVFNDHRGNLNANVHGTRVLSPLGHSSHLGGGVNWKNSNAAASLDVSKQIHGPTSMMAHGGGVWKVGKNADLSAMGTMSHTFGSRSRPDFGGMANFRYRF